MKIFLVLVLLILTVTIYGQNESAKQEAVKIDLSEACNKDKTSWAVQELPVYAGGNKKLIDDLNHLLTIDNDLTGKCSVSFLVNCEGKASGFVIIEGDKKSDLNTKIVESLEKLQSWQPGKLNNENVDCTFTLRLAVKAGYLVPDY